MRKLSKIWMIASAVAILGLLAGCGPTPTPTPTPVAGPTPTPVVIPTPEWEAAEYVNEEYGFSIKYPEEYAEEALRGAEVLRVRAPGLFPIMTVSIVDVEEGTTFADLAETFKSSLENLGATNIEIVSEKETTLADGITPAYELVVEWFAMGYSLKSLYLSLIKDNKLFTVSLTDTAGAYAGDEVELMQIAYSLQFE